MRHGCHEGESPLLLGPPPVRRAPFSASRGVLSRPHCCSQSGWESAVLRDEPNQKGHDHGEDDFQNCHYSIACWTDDLGVVYCLRALCALVEKDCPRQIGWRGTKEHHWREAGDQVTFRFTSPTYRDDYVREAKRLLPPGSWKERARSDSDPATRRRK